MQISPEFSIQEELSREIIETTTGVDGPGLARPPFVRPRPCFVPEALNRVQRPQKVRAKASKRKGKGLEKLGGATSGSFWQIYLLEGIWHLVECV